MLYTTFITEFEQLRITYFDRRLSKELLEDCVNLLKVKTEEEELNDGDNKSWYDWFRLECRCLVTGVPSNALPSREGRRVVTKEFDIGLLFVLNKLFAAWNLKQGNALSLKWEAFLNDVMPTITRFFKTEKKERDHVVKLMSVWETGKFFSKEAIDHWRHIDSHSTSNVEESAVPAPDAHPPQKKKRKLDDNASIDSKDTAATKTTPSAHTTASSSSGAHNNTTDNSSSSVQTRPKIERQVSSDGPAPITDLRSASVHTMYQFTHEICKKYFDAAANTNDKVYWRIFEITAYFLLHRLSADFELGEDEVTLCFASLYLSGKIENMFLTTEKLRNTADALVGKCFGTARALPTDEEILRYETDLLQLIKFDINQIKNPMKFCQDMVSRGELDKTSLLGMLVVSGDEEFLAERRYFEFDSTVSACVLYMIVLCRDVKDGDSAMMRTKLKVVFDSEMYRAVHDHLQLIGMVSKVRKHSVKLLRAPIIFYEQFVDLFPRYTDIPIESVPEDFLYHPAPTGTDNSQ